MTNTYKRLRCILLLMALVLFPTGFIHSEVFAATIQGHVSASGVSVSGARITATSGVTITAYSDDSGDYSMPVPAPELYSISVYSYGYLSETVDGVVVAAAGDIITQDFDLSPNPAKVTVTGTVTDTNTGWALYAKILLTADGFDSFVFTDPVTGAYSVDLVQDEEVHFKVEAIVEGYLSEKVSVIPPSGGTTQDFDLQGTVDAPGYSASAAFFDDFEKGLGNWTPTGLWNLELDTDTCGSGVSPFPSPVLGAYYGDDSTCTYETAGVSNFGSLTLNTPMTIPAGAVLSFWSYEETEAFTFFDRRYVEVSNDNGSTWVSLGECGFEDAWYQASFDLSAYAGMDILIRFRFDTIDPAKNGFFGWMIDDVIIDTPVAPLSGGLVVGNAYNANTGEGAKNVTLDDGSGHRTAAFATPDDPALDDGMFILYVPASGDITASASRYGDVTRSVTIVDLGVVKQDFDLPAGQLSCPASIVQYIMPDTVLDIVKTFVNTGAMTLDYEIEPPTQTAAILTPAQGALGDVLDLWSDGLTYAWGIGVDLSTHDLWLGNIKAGGGDDLDYRFLMDGTKTGDTIDTSGWVVAYAADMAFDWATGRLWQMNLAGDNCIHELDPVAMVSGNTICPSFPVPQFGLAYDPLSDTFYAGGLDRSIYRFDRSGTILETTFVDLAISGLAFHPATGHLFCLLNVPASSSEVVVLDINDNYSVADQFDITGFADGSGAGLGMDCGGALWAVDQVNHLVFQIDTGEGPIGCDIPWLDENPENGTIEASSSLDVTFTFDSTGLKAGDTLQGTILVKDTTPYYGTGIPVEMRVVNQTYEVVFETGAHGTIQGELSQIAPENGDCTPVSALPDSGYTFDGWSGGYNGDENPLTITSVQSDMTITANFKEKSSPSGGGGGGGGGCFISIITGD